MSLIFWKQVCYLEGESCFGKNLRGFFLVLLISVVTHFFYSRYGFNPTDEGFTLAYARRILDGQVPHRDFIIIRPALSPMVHIFEVLWGGQYVFWISRFIFFLQIATISFLCILFMDAIFNKVLSAASVVLLSLVSFVFCCHSFPAMAWHTVDGLFFCAIALYLRVNKFRCHIPLSYLFWGAAVLSKQSFVFMGPLSLLLFRDWRHMLNIVSFLLPIVLYLSVISLLGGSRDMFIQLLVQTGLKKTGYDPYFTITSAKYLALGWGLQSVLCYSCFSNKKMAKMFCPTLLFLFSFALFAWLVGSFYHQTLFYDSFSLIPFLLGILISDVVFGKKIGEMFLRGGVLLIFLAWSASLSLGYNSPVLLSGVILSYILVKYSMTISVDHVIRTFSLIVLTSLALFAFHVARTENLYRDASINFLTEDLGEILPGASLIYSNENTARFLEDLNMAISRATADEMQYAIIPDNAAHWVSARQANPLSIDWHQGTELASRELVDRAVKQADGKKGEIRIIVQKVRASELRSGFLPFKENDSHYAVLNHIRNMWVKISETEHFEIYGLN